MGQKIKSITGWDKKTFERFSNFITSANQSSKRTIDELIAIYRYWLRKGVDQFTLAKLRGNTTQQQISRYLDQIRCVINKDFVPYYLGAASRTREFFIQHNNLTTTELHELGPDCLAIVVDSTYTRLEKSNNNQFQYDCWSGQKMDLLIKPFIMCCSDGYFIDCYGPFRAHMNDASIFKHVLETDPSLKDILHPEKTYVFLDRGKLEYNQLEPC